MKIVFKTLELNLQDGREFMKQSSSLGVGIVQLDESDVIRNKLVKKVVNAYRNYSKQ